MTSSRLRSCRLQQRAEWLPGGKAAPVQPQADGASGCAGRSYQMLGGMALVLVLRLRHAQHGSAAAQPRRANFGRNQPQRRPFSRSDTHPRPRRPAAARASISRRSASASRREQSSSQSREIVTLRNYLGNGEANQSGVKLGLILAMPSTCDIRGVWAES